MVISATNWPIHSVLPFKICKMILLISVVCIYVLDINGPTKYLLLLLPLGSTYCILQTCSYLRTVIQKSLTPLAGGFWNGTVQTMEGLDICNVHSCMAYISIDKRIGFHCQSVVRHRRIIFAQVWESAPIFRDCATTSHAQPFFVWVCLFARFSLRFLLADYTC